MSSFFLYSNLYLTFIYPHTTVIFIKPAMFYYSNFGFWGDFTIEKCVHAFRLIEVQI